METIEVSDEHLLLRPQISRFFAFAAAITVLVLLVMYSILIANRVFGYQATASFMQSAWIKYFVFLLGIVGAPSALCLWLGMCWYWLEIDDSSRRAKAFWFFVVFLANFVGAPFYYFFVYRRANSS